MSGKLDLDPATVARPGRWPARSGRPIVRIAQQHTTVSVERATLRLAGLEGADAEGTPWVNRLIDVVRADVGLEHGVALPVWDALLPRRGRRPARRSPRRPRAGSVRFRMPEGRDAHARAHGRPRARSAPASSGSTARRVGARAADRKRSATHPRKPWIYLIVATGDIYEDIPQAQAAAREGADVIAVIRSTGQSLLDYVPEGATREGFAGTYATQENFRLMRAALDESQQRARPLRPARPTTPPGSACRRSPRWPASSGST